MYMQRGKPVCGCVQGFSFSWHFAPQHHTLATTVDHVCERSDHYVIVIAAGVIRLHCLAAAGSAADALPNIFTYGSIREHIRRISDERAFEMYVEFQDDPPLG